MTTAHDTDTVTAAWEANQRDQQAVAAVMVSTLRERDRAAYDEARRDYDRLRREERSLLRDLDTATLVKLEFSEARRATERVLAEHNAIAKVRRDALHRRQADARRAAEIAAVRAATCPACFMVKAPACGC